jgi:fibronectin type III domain protein
MTLRRFSLASSLALSIAFSTFACSDEHGGGNGPAAPSGLAAEALGDGAHLTWTDNSDDETGFMVMRMEHPDGDYEELGTVPFDTTQYHDEPLTSGTTYMYMVMAINDGGESDSNEVLFTAP